MTGPHDPLAPAGPPVEVSRTWWGSVIRYQEYDDGWMYEAELPSSVPLQPQPGPQLLRLIIGNPWIGALHEEGSNYLTVWVPRTVHERLMPDGPPPYEYVLRESTDPEAHEEEDRWLAEHSPNDTNPLRLVEIAKALEAEKHRNGSDGHLD